MKTQGFLFKSLMVIALSAVVLTSCKKDEDEDNDTSISNDNALAEATFQDAGNIADEAATSGSLSNYKLGGNDGLLSACATITHDSLVNTDLDTVTVDFGSTNCTCADGRNRRGQVIVTYTGRYRDSLTTINIGFNNYFVNDNQVLGTKTIVNNGHNAAGNLVYTITVNGQIVKANNGGTITWNANKVREWTAGEGTLVWNDDMYSITGSASGTGANGSSYTANITSPLIRNMAVGCRRHFVQGTFDLTPANKPTRTVNFGNGACDNIATVTINNNTYTIQLN